MVVALPTMKFVCIPIMSKASDKENYDIHPKEHSTASRYHIFMHPLLMKVGSYGDGKYVWP